MPLAELTPGISDWHDVKHAALVLLKASASPDVTALQNDLRNHYMNPELTTIDIHTGINQGRVAILAHNHEEIIIAFQGSADDEIHMNLWTDGKGANWRELPYPVRFKGNRVHSFYLDMWNGMKTAVFSALDDAIATTRNHDMVLKKVIISGYSMGGGVSTLGHRLDPWISASTGAGDHGYLTLLNKLYERYQIRAWDFLNRWDQTQFLPPYHFRCWRGYRYILPHEVTHRFGARFGPMRHGMQGYYQAAEWMAEYGFDQVKSAYPSGYA